MEQDNKETKFCPCCGEEILKTAKKCRFCGEWLKESETSENAQTKKLGFFEKLKTYKESTPVKILRITFNIINGLVALLIGGGLGLSANSGELAIGLAVIIYIALCLSTYFYFLPTYIADINNHRKTTTILIINLFFGETVIGWFIPLIWALNDENLALDVNINKK